MPNSKYRPAFTVAQLSRILSLAQDSQNCDDVSTTKILIPLLAKITCGATLPAYTPTPQSQEALDKAILSDRTARYNADTMTQEESALYEAEILGM